ncbi:hypothetical protein B0A50_00905 [Salinomyces thailandicus]|uniref:GID complex catalytic subunit 2 n=1 Tax=Salinomyces thailandicus TaxID=706561 RepID=A0A4U0UER6_9PEZI|nr:hypothetical protein B0A50_00905 [Salinomyces thailandica]
MDGLLACHNTLEKKANLSKAVTDVQKLVEQLQSARDAVADNPDMAVLHMAKLKNPVKQSFDRIEEDLKEVNKGLNQYQKALKDKFKSSTLPTAGVGESGLLSRQAGLVDRAIGMHLLREGMFGVADTFVKEVQQSGTRGSVNCGEEMEGVELSSQQWLKDFTTEQQMTEDKYDEEEEEEEEDDEDLYTDDEDLYTGLEKPRLQERFADMYHILDALRNRHNLLPAIDWARDHSQQLESRGSNLEFELARLKFIELYTSSSSSSHSPHNDPFAGPLQALEYARTVFPTFTSRYRYETSSLLGSLAFAPALASSPYKPLFHNPSAWSDAAAAFTREYCGLLGLSEQSPLYAAVTAGGIALPVLEKVERVMAQTKGQWTSVNELPVETPLPPGYLFHSIFVCPVSKEQATDANPPVMLPCGHVIARESLEGHSKGKQRVKCPYCPQECLVRDARRVYI